MCLREKTGGVGSTHKYVVKQYYVGVGGCVHVCVCACVCVEARGVGVSKNRMSHLI